MNQEIITIVVSGAGAIFVLDRAIALVKVLREHRTNGTQSPEFALIHDHIKSALDQIVDNQARITDSQDRITAVLHEIAEGLAVLMDRRPVSDRPKTAELLQLLDNRRRYPADSDSPPKPKPR